MGWIGTPVGYRWRIKGGPGHASWGGHPQELKLIGRRESKYSYMSRDWVFGERKRREIWGVCVCVCLKGVQYECLLHFVIAQLMIVELNGVLKLATPLPMNYWDLRGTKRAERRFMAYFS